MNTAKYVDQQIAALKTSGIPLSEAAWEAAKLCAGWPYIFGDRGAYCTPSHRRAVYASKGDDHPTIKSKCKNFEGGKSCNGCTFYPDGVTRAFDCRGYTYWVLLQVYGWKLMGAGATSQWNNAANWKAKGLVKDGIPQGVIVCLFYHEKGSSTVMAHTGFYFNGETCECGNGVQHAKTIGKKWTHWAVPACVEGDTVIPSPAPDPETPPAGRPTLRKGSKGEFVTLLQTELFQRGYDLGSWGIDGDFGSRTEEAVKAFQTDRGLTADGICGPATWAALDGNEAAPAPTWRVTIPHLTESRAAELMTLYPEATREAE